MKELNMVWWNGLSREEQAEVPPHQRPEGVILKERKNEGKTTAP